MRVTFFRHVRSPEKLKLNKSEGRNLHRHGNFKIVRRNIHSKMAATRHTDQEAIETSLNSRGPPQTEQSQKYLNPLFSPRHAQLIPNFSQLKFEKSSHENRKHTSFTPNSARKTGATPTIPPLSHPAYSPLPMPPPAATKKQVPKLKQHNHVGIK